MTGAKRDEPVEILFEVWTRVGQRYHEVGGPGSPTLGKGQLGGASPGPLGSIKNQTKSNMTLITVDRPQPG